jgi:hypothetical protein
MKTQLIKLTLLSAMMILTSVASAHAQSLADRVRFNVPFDFTFGEKQLSAGQYSVGRAMPNSGDTVLSIRDDNGYSRALMLSHPAMRSQTQTKTKASLVFHRYGEQYFLVQVWPAGAAAGREFAQSKSERAMQRQLTSNPSTRKVAQTEKFETVIVAAAGQ